MKPVGTVFLQWLQLNGFFVCGLSWVFSSKVLSDDCVVLVGSSGVYFRAFAG